MCSKSNTYRLSFLVIAHFMVKGAKSQKSCSKEQDFREKIEKNYEKKMIKKFFPFG